MNERTYRFGRSKLTLIFGDLTKAQADVLVSSDDYMLTMGGGVSAALRRAAGEALIIDAIKKVPAQRGDVVVTTAGMLPAKHIFHAITIGDDSNALTNDEVILRTTRRCLALLDQLGLDSIAFPAIGAGVAGFKYGDVAIRMADVISENLKSRQRPTEVSIYLFDSYRLLSPIDFIRFFEEFASRVSNLPPPEPEKVANKSDVDKETKDDPARPITPRQQIAQALGELTQERD